MPATYIQPMKSKGGNSNLLLTPFQRRERQMHSTPRYIDPSPEKILQNHSSLQQSTRPLPSLSPRLPTHTNGYYSDGFSPRLHISGDEGHEYKKGVPEAPSSFKVSRLEGEATLVLTWKLPQLNELAHSNGSQVIGYKVRL